MLQIHHHVSATFRGSKYSGLCANPAGGFSDLSGSCSSVFHWRFCFLSLLSEGLVGPGPEQTHEYWSTFQIISSFLTTRASVLNRERLQTLQMFASYSCIKISFIFSSEASVSKEEEASLIFHDLNPQAETQYAAYNNRNNTKLNLWQTEAPLLPGGCWWRWNHAGENQYLQILSTQEDNKL